MSSSRFQPLRYVRLPARRVPSLLVDLLACVAAGSVLAGAALPAFAQVAMPQLPNVQARPSMPGMPAPSGMTAGGMASPIGPPQPSSFGGQRRAADQPTALPAKLPDQPDGGFGTVAPAPGREDPAMRMGLRNADGYVRKMGQESDAALQGNLEGALPNASIPNESDLVSLQKVQREMQLLDAKQRLAEVAVKYWGTVFNNADAKEYREVEAKQKKEDVAERQKQQEAEEKRQAMAAQAAAVAQQSQRPVVQVSAAQARVFDVMGSEARIAWPGGGVMVVHPGDRLPDGSRVATVGASGVVAVDTKGNRMPVMMADSSGAGRR